MEKQLVLNPNSKTIIFCKGKTEILLHCLQYSKIYSVSKWQKKRKEKEKKVAYLINMTN